MIPAPDYLHLYDPLTNSVFLLMFYLGLAIFGTLCVMIGRSN